MIYYSSYGGSWLTYFYEISFLNRDGVTPNEYGDDLGFRLIKTIKQ
jgi:hypothetical protein